MKYCFLRYPGGRFKAVTLSYDDGKSSDINLADIINSYGIKATFNINSCAIGCAGRLTEEEIKKYIIKRGHEIAIHGKNHIAPGIGKPEMVISDIINCRKMLEKTFDCIVRGMAYPDTGILNMHNGNSVDNIKSYVKNLGIVYARTIKEDYSFMLPEDFLNWKPTAHHEAPNLTELVKKFVELKEKETKSFGRYPRLFYLWGHSSEFEANKNWNIIESFCKQISFKEDTWYATNMEIYEYVKAYNELVMSADGSKIYNPTLKEIWMDIDGKRHTIKPDETINI